MNWTKRFLTLTIPLVACGACLAGQPAERIKFATVLPRGTSTHQALLEMTAKWRPACVTTTLYMDAVMGGEAETVRRMRIGQIQGALLSVAGLTEIDHSATALQLMPMVFRTLDEVAYVRQKLRPLLEKQFEEKGFVMLFLADAGWVKIFSRRPVLRPEDLKKQKLFALTSDSSQGDLMKAAGYQPVALEYTDILTGLQTGIIDSVPTPPFYALAGQFYQPAPYMLDMNYAPLVGAFVMTRKAWDALPPSTQALLRRSAEETGSTISAQNHKEMEEAIAAMQKRGLTVTHMTPQAETEWRALFESVYPKIRGNLVPANLFDEVQRLLREFRK